MYIGTFFSKCIPVSALGLGEADKRL